MTTYYGVWAEQTFRQEGVLSGKEWWYTKHELFYTRSLGIARAQAKVANAVAKGWQHLGWEGHWEARLIGEDGLPTPKETIAGRMSQSRELGICDICGEPAMVVWSRQLIRDPSMVTHSYRCEAHIASWPVLGGRE